MENKNVWVVKSPYYPPADISHLSVKQLVDLEFKIKKFYVKISSLLSYLLKLLNSKRTIQIKIRLFLSYVKLIIKKNKPKKI